MNTGQFIILLFVILWFDILLYYAIIEKIEKLKNSLPPMIKEEE